MFKIEEQKIINLQAKRIEELEKDLRLANKNINDLKKKLERIKRNNE